MMHWYIKRLPMGDLIPKMILQVKKETPPLRTQNRRRECDIAEASTNKFLPSSKTLKLIPENLYPYRLMWFQQRKITKFGAQKTYSNILHARPNINCDSRAGEKCESLNMKEGCFWQKEGHMFNEWILMTQLNQIVWTRQSGMKKSGKTDKCERAP